MTVRPDHDELGLLTSQPHADLLFHHDAVAYAVGASADRALGMPGEDLLGSLSARTSAGWYDAQPEVPAAGVGLDPASPGRVVVVVVDGGPEVASVIAGAAPGGKAAALRGLEVRDVDWTSPPPARLRLVLRFYCVVDPGLAPVGPGWPPCRGRHRVRARRGRGRRPVRGASGSRPTTSPPSGATQCSLSTGGLMRRYERDVDGVGWHDGLLMNLLA